MYGIIKSMSVKTRGYWGLVEQVGPWKPTLLDEARTAVYNADSPTIVRPYVVRAGSAPIRLSKLAQRKIVDKPYLPSNASKRIIGRGRRFGGPVGSRSEIGTQTDGNALGKELRLIDW